MVIFLALVLFFGATVELEKNKTVLHPQETLEVTLSCTYDARERPNFFELIEEIEQQKRYGSFELQAYKIKERAPNTIVLALTLKPMKLGTLTFAPGLLTVENGKALEVPSFEIPCTRLYKALSFFPALPVRPEEAITLDERTREAVNRETSKAIVSLVEEKEFRGRVWTLLFTLFFCGIFVFGGMLFSRWYREQHKKQAPRVLRNWKQELLHVATNSELSAFLKEYYSEKSGLPLRYKTAEELQMIFQDNEPLKALFRRLEQAEFSGKPQGEEGFQENLREAQLML